MTLEISSLREIAEQFEKIKLENQKKEMRISEANSKQDELKKMLENAEIEMGVLLGAKKELEEKLGIQKDENQKLLKDLQEANADLADSREKMSKLKN